MSADCGEDNAIRTPRPGAVDFRPGFITFSKARFDISERPISGAGVKVRRHRKGRGRVGQVGRTPPVAVEAGRPRELRAG